jgi:hypothetical protein
MPQAGENAANVARNAAAIGPRYAKTVRIKFHPRASVIATLHHAVLTLVCFERSITPCVIAVRGGNDERGEPT